MQYYLDSLFALAEATSIASTGLSIRALTSQAREPVWEFCPLLSIVIPLIHSVTREMTTG